MTIIIHLQKNKVITVLALNEKWQGMEQNILQLKKNWIIKKTSDSACIQQQSLVETEELHGAAYNKNLWVHFKKVRKHHVAASDHFRKRLQAAFPPSTHFPFFCHCCFQLSTSTCSLIYRGLLCWPRWDSFCLSNGCCGRCYLVRILGIN